MSNDATRKQYPPFFDVKVLGTTVQWTDRRIEAHQAYERSNATQKEIWMVDERGGRTLVRSLRNGSEMNLRAAA